MANTKSSRRKFIASLAATGAAAQLTGLSSMANQPWVPEEVNIPFRNNDDPLKIVSTMKFSQEESDQIKKAGKNIELIQAERNNVKEFLGADGIIGFPEVSVFTQSKKLKWVQWLGAGVEDRPQELINHACILTNMQRIYAPVIAESAVGLLLSLTRGLTQVSHPAFAEKKWKHAPADVALDDLYHKTIGIVGMGGIGSETAYRLHYGFGMKVLATDAKAMPKPAFVDELHDPGWFMEMVPKVDVLMSAAPLTNETKKMFNDSVFQKMKSSAYFINVSRGGLVDQPALTKALKSKKIRGAGLDVTSPEPLPPDDELWTCNNLIITPHNSGNAPIRQKRLINLIAENVRRFSNGLPLMNVVDKVKGY